jgi:hypothetical protein
MVNSAVSVLCAQLTIWVDANPVQEFPSKPVESVAVPT